MEIFTLLENLEDILDNSRGLPFSQKSIVDKGEIIECGTPEELMALKGKYYKLIEIQSMGEQLQKRKAEENFE